MAAAQIMSPRAQKILVAHITSAQTGQKFIQHQVLIRKKCSSLQQLDPNLYACQEIREYGESSK